MTPKTYDIYNPTQARRVIYDGTTAQKQIAIEPGATKKGMPLADHIFERLQHENSDLKVTESKPVPFTPQTDDPQKMKPTLGLPGLKK